jgi:lysophospholipase L1-like esterase
VLPTSGSKLEATSLMYARQGALDKHLPKAALLSPYSRAAASPLSERGRASVVLCLAIVLAGLVLGGCGAGQSTGPSDGGQSSASPSATAAAQTGAAKIQILVLGDSYSAGNGAGDYAGPTDCFRSPNNYAGNLATMLDVKYGVHALVTNDACSGQEASQFFTSVSGRLPESDAVNSSYKLVLLTFGGNDVNFGGIVKFCLIAKFQSGDHCIRNLDTAVADLKGGVQNSPIAYVLSSALQYIHSHDPDARIVLLGYPYLESDQTYTVVDRREGSNSVAGDACGQRQGTTNIVTVGQCLHEIGNLGEQLQSELIANLNSQDHTTAFVFVSTQELFAGTQPGFVGPNHELTATAVNPNRWFIQPFVDVDPGPELLNTPWGSPVFYHPDPTGWEEEAKLLMATPAVVDGLASGQATTTQPPATTTQPPPTTTQPPPTTTESTVTSTPTTTGSLTSGASFNSTCVVAWPTAPTITSNSIQMTMSCNAVPESEYLFTVVTYGDPTLPICPDHPDAYVVGTVSGTATSDYGYKELLVQASSVKVQGQCAS